MKIFKLGKSKKDLLNEDLKTFLNDKKSKLKELLDKVILRAREEKEETVAAAKILKRVIFNSDSVSKEEVMFLKEQSKDLMKLFVVVGLGAISTIIPIVIEKWLKRYDMSIMPKKQEIPRKENEES
jgi:hypothetical protein